jgi:hypothetical protein
LQELLTKDKLADVAIVGDQDLTLGFGYLEDSLIAKRARVSLHD